MSALFRRSFKSIIFRRFLKVPIATSNFMNEVYNGRFAPEFSVSVLKETITLDRGYVPETRKWKVKPAKKYMWKRNMKSFFNETLIFFSILVKRIIIFVTYPDTMKQRLTERNTWLKESHFPYNIKHIMMQLFKDKTMKLKVNVRHLLLCFSKILIRKSFVNSIGFKLMKCNHIISKMDFEDLNIMLPQWQPKNMLDTNQSSFLLK